MCPGLPKLKSAIESVPAFTVTCGPTGLRIALQWSVSEDIGQEPVEGAVVHE